MNEKTMRLSLTGEAVASSKWIGDGRWTNMSFHDKVAY